MKSIKSEGYTTRSKYLQKVCNFLVCSRAKMWCMRGLCLFIITRTINGYLPTKYMIRATESSFPTRITQENLFPYEEFFRLNSSSASIVIKNFLCKENRLPQGPMLIHLVALVTKSVEKGDNVVWTSCG